MKPMITWGGEAHDGVAGVHHVKGNWCCCNVEGAEELLPRPGQDQLMHIVEKLNKSLHIVIQNWNMDNPEHLPSREMPKDALIHDDGVIQEWLTVGARPPAAKC
jgi:hypothetical protein